MIDDTYLAQELRVAILTSQLHLALQPKFCLKTMTTSGYEVLLQWHHPKHNLIPAERWVSIAEEYGLMTQLTLWLVDQVCRVLANNQTSNLPLAINISPGYLNVSIAKAIIAKLKAYKTNFTLFEVEITESTAPECLVELASAIKVLRQNGIKVALDDFGKGFSSMQYLVDLEVDEIKIDKTFVHKATQGKAAFRIIKSMIDLAKALDLSVVCEGIELLEHLNLCQELGADRGQGYLYARPVRLHQITQSQAANLSTAATLKLAS